MQLELDFEEDDNLDSLPWDIDEFFEDKDDADNEGEEDQ